MSFVDNPKLKIRIKLGEVLMRAILCVARYLLFKGSNVGRFACLCLLLGVLGCGEALPEGPKTYPVTGKLTVGGKPLADINVQLIPLDPSGLGAAGKTDAEGAFKIVATSGKDGAAAGKYKVVLQKTGAVDSAQYATPGAGGPPKVELPFPAEYSTATTSTKEIEVTDKPVTLDLSL